MKVRRWAPTVAALAIVVVAVLLGNWQMRRAEEKRALQSQRDAAQREPVELLAAPAAPAAPAANGERPGSAAPDERGSLDGRRVRVRGTFLPQFQVFVDNRTHRGVAGFHVLAPLRIAHSDRHVLVLRGWVAGDPHKRGRLPEVRTPEEPVEIEGIALRELPRMLELAKIPPPGPGDRIWQNADLEGYARWSGLSMQPPVVRESLAPRVMGGTFDDGLVREWPQPGAGIETHLGYAFQWYALAALAAGLWVHFVAFGSRRRARGAGPARSEESDRQARNDR